MKSSKIILTIVLTIGIGISGYAQCVMCKATAEQGNAAGYGQGLNEGILYLAAIPYSVLLIFGIYFYLKHKKKQKEIEKVGRY